MLKGALRNTNWLKNTRHCQQICSEQDLTKSKLLLWDRDRVDTWRAALISKHLLTLYLDCKINPAQSIFSTPTNNHALPFRWEWYTANQSPPSVPWMCVCVCIRRATITAACTCSAWGPTLLAIGVAARCRYGGRRGWSGRKLGEIDLSV